MHDYFFLIVVWGANVGCCIFKQKFLMHDREITMGHLEHLDAFAHLHCLEIRMIGHIVPVGYQHFVLQSSMHRVGMYGGE